jgi:hypothetical protein
MESFAMENKDLVELTKSTSGSDSQDENSSEGEDCSEVEEIDSSIVFCGTWAGEALS